MAQGKKRTGKKKSNGANLGFEEKLWQAADKMRGHMDPAEYKHVALRLIFLKYISDAFEERHGYLENATADPSNALYIKEPEARYGAIEDRDEYTSENIFWVPKEARWRHLQANAKQPAIGKLIDDAMVAIEKANPFLKGVLPKDYARQSLDKQRKMGYMVDRTHRELSDEDIARIASTYHAWRSSSPLPFAGEGKGEGAAYKDIPGFCKGSTIEDIASHGYVLTPGRYVGAEAVEDDDEPFDEKMKHLTAKLEEQFAESEKLEKAIRENLKKVGYGF